MSFRHRRAGPLGLALALALAGCGPEALNRSEMLNPSRVYEAESDIARTFDLATVLVPRGPAAAPLIGRMRDPALAAALAAPGRPWPVVLYLHGCNGIGATDRLETLAEAGFVVVAPNSFARRFRPLQCRPSAKAGGENVFVFDFRLAEISYALHRFESLDWVDHWRLFLVGDSEGGAAAALYRGEWFRARVITEWTCHGNYFVRGLAAPPEEPVLAIVRAGDPYYDPARTRNQQGDCGAYFGARPRSRSLVLEGDGGHDVYDDPETLPAILDFLKAELARVPAQR